MVTILHIADIRSTTSGTTITMRLQQRYEEGISHTDTISTHRRMIYYTNTKNVHIYYSISNSRWRIKQQVCTSCSCDLSNTCFLVIATSSLSNSVKSIVIPKEQEELIQMTQLMRVFKPKLPPPSSQPPSLPPLLPIRRSSSLGTWYFSQSHVISFTHSGNIADVSGDSDSQLQLALAASLGLDHPTPSPARIRSSSSSSNLPEAVTFTDLTAPAGISLKSVKMNLFDA